VIDANFERRFQGLAERRDGFQGSQLTDLKNALSDSPKVRSVTPNSPGKCRGTTGGSLVRVVRGSGFYRAGRFVARMPATAAPLYTIKGRERNLND
jgi:hypothetical protein